MNRFVLFFAISCAAGLLLSCRQESEIRRYREVVSGPPKSPSRGAMPDDDIHRAVQGSAATPDLAASSAAGLTWSAPPGWIEEPGKGMRLATLRPKNTLGDCTIVSLGGVAGGTEANILRWLGQLNIALDKEALAHFIADADSFETSSGLAGRIYDFTTLISGDDEPGMLAGVFELGQQTVFVKYASVRSVLIENRRGFLSLCESLEVAE